MSKLTGGNLYEHKLKKMKTGKITKANNYLCGNPFSARRWVESTDHSNLYIYFDMCKDLHSHFDVNVDIKNSAIKYDINFDISNLVMYAVDVIEHCINIAEKTNSLVDESKKPNIIVTYELPHLYYVYVKHIIDSLLYIYRDDQNKKQELESFLSGYTSHLESIINQWRNHIINNKDRIFYFMSPGMSRYDFIYIKHDISNRLWFYVLSLFFIMKSSGISYNQNSEAHIYVSDVVNIKSNKINNEYKINAFISISELIALLKYFDFDIKSAVSDSISDIAEQYPNRILNRLPAHEQRIIAI